MGLCECIEGLVYCLLQVFKRQMCAFKSIAAFPLIVLLLGCGPGSNNSVTHTSDDFGTDSVDENLYCPTPGLLDVLSGFAGCKNIEDPEEKSECYADYNERWSCREQPEPRFILNGEEYFGVSFKVDDYARCLPTTESFRLTVTGDYFKDNDIYGGQRDITSYANVKILRGSNVASVAAQGDGGINVVFDNSGFALVELSLPQALSDYPSQQTRMFHLAAIAESSLPVTLKQYHPDGCDIALFQESYCDVTTTDPAVFSFQRITYDSSTSIYWNGNGVDIDKNCNYGEVDELADVAPPDFQAIKVVSLP